MRRETAAGEAQARGREFFEQNRIARFCFKQGEEAGASLAQFGEAAADVAQLAQARGGVGVLQSPDGAMGGGEGGPGQQAAQGVFVGEAAEAGFEGVFGEKLGRLGRVGRAGRSFFDRELAVDQGAARFGPFGARIPLDAVDGAAAVQKPIGADRAIKPDQGLRGPGRSSTSSASRNAGGLAPANRAWLPLHKASWPEGFAFATRSGKA